MTIVLSRPASWSRPFHALSHPREVIRQFTPNWFTVTMGTGVLALVLVQTRLAPLRPVAEGLWLLNILLFALCVALYGARWLMFPGQARRIFGHPIASMFLGAIPMGLATIVNGLMTFGPAHWGQAAYAVAEALWMLDAVLAVACGLGIPLMMFTRQTHDLPQMTALWLLPVVAAEVAAVTAGLLAPHLATGQAQLQMLVIGYVLWALSVPLALSLLAILLLRLALHKLPRAEMAVSSWLAVGPLGTGALGLLVLGADASAAFASAGLAEVGEAALGLGVIGGLLLWAYGLWWLALAILATLRQLRLGLPFNLGWWGFTFPLGVFTLATQKLGAVLHMPLFDGIGAVLAVTLAVLWTIVAARTAVGAYEGRLFHSPCIADTAG